MLILQDHLAKLRLKLEKLEKLEKLAKEWSYLALVQCIQQVEVEMTVKN